MRHAAIVGLIIVLAGAAYALAQLGAGTERRWAGEAKWEYLVEDLRGDGKGNFDQRGAQGWELVAVTPCVQRGIGAGFAIDSRAYYKRQKQN